MCGGEYDLWCGVALQLKFYMLYEGLYSLFSRWPHASLCDPYCHIIRILSLSYLQKSANLSPCVPISSIRQTIMFGESVSNLFLEGVDPFLWFLEERLEEWDYFVVTRLIFPFIDIFNTNSQ